MKIGQYIIVKQQYYGMWRYVIKKYSLFGYRPLRVNWSGNTVHSGILSSIFYDVKLFNSEDDAVREINNILYKKTIEHGEAKGSRPNN